MFECKLCIDTIMRIQTEIPRIIVLTVVPPTGKQCISFGRESGRQFWRDAAVDSWPQDVDTSQDVDPECVDSGGGAEAGHHRHHRHQGPGLQDQAGRGGQQGHGEISISAV